MLFSHVKISSFRAKAHLVFHWCLLPPQGFHPEGEIPRRHSSNSRVWKVLTVEIDSHTANIEKISICLNRCREESVGNDGVFIVCARKYEMVRMA